MFEMKSKETLAAIEDVVRNYFHGYLRAEPETLSKAFHSDARLFSTDKGSLEKTEMSEWLANLAKRRDKGDVREAEVTIDGVDVSGDAAVVKTSFVFPKFKFIDYLSLLYINNEWKIINKIYTEQKI